MHQQGHYRQSQRHKRHKRGNSAHHYSRIAGNHLNNNKFGSDEYDSYDDKYYKSDNNYDKSRTGHCGYTVWIGNIPKTATKPHIVKILEEFGEILNIYVLMQSKNHFNCAFVDFLSPYDIIAIGKAVSYHKLKIYDTEISVVLREKTSYVFFVLLLCRFPFFILMFF